MLQPSLAGIGIFLPALDTARHAMVRLRSRVWAVALEALVECVAVGTLLPAVLVHLLRACAVRLRSRIAVSSHIHYICCQPLHDSYQPWVMGILLAGW
jgi:hypothetical protein